MAVFKSDIVEDLYEIGEVLGRCSNVCYISCSSSSLKGLYFTNYFLSSCKICIKGSFLDLAQSDISSFSVNMGFKEG